MKQFCSPASAGANNWCLTTTSTPECHLSSSCPRAILGHLHFKESNTVVGGLSKALKCDSRAIPVGCMLLKSCPVLGDKVEHETCTAKCTGPYWEGHLWEAAIVRKGWCFPSPAHALLGFLGFFLFCFFNGWVSTHQISPSVNSIKTITANLGKNIPLVYPKLPPHIHLKNS